MHICLHKVFPGLLQVTMSYGMVIQRPAVQTLLQSAPGLIMLSKQGSERAKGAENVVQKPSSKTLFSESPFCLLPASSFERKQQGGFEKGWFWRMCPRSGWCWGNIRMYGRSGFGTETTSECTLVPFFGTGEHPPKPPLWKPPFCQPPKVSSQI